MESEFKNEQQNINMDNNEINIKQPEINNNIFETKINNIDNKFNYFQNTKDNYDKLFIHEYIENIHLIENNQEIIDKKLNFLKMKKDFNNDKKPELDKKILLKRQTKNLFIEELSNIKKEELNNDSYFNISPEEFTYNNNNKNSLYKSDGLLNIF